MNNPESSILCIFDVNGQAVGSGFLVTSTLAMTCAHVVRSAIGSTELGKSINMDLPLVESGKMGVGRVIFLDQDKDIACLEMDKSLISDTSPAKMVIADNLWGHTFRAFGFPQGYQNGVWSSGVLRGNTGDGWLQIEDIKDAGFNIQPGFSGGLVWDDQLQSVVGMIVAAEMDRTIKAAFCLPTRELINIYPALKDYSALLCPYRSLDVFTENDKDLFFGRDSVISTLIRSLKREPRFLAVSGPSGSGKSSLIKAGLIPQLKNGKVSGSERWHFLTIRPGTQPFTQLENVGLTNIRPDMVVAVHSWLSEHPSVTRLVLFIDQFEELLIVTPRDIRNDFISEIAKLLNSPMSVTIIFTLRDDFHVRFLAEALPLHDWYLRNTAYVPPVVEVDELHAMIANPAGKTGAEFEKGLIESIIKDAIEVNREKEQAESTILPLLEFALTQMWDIKHGNLLTHDDYQKIGGVSGGLSRWADKAYYDLNDEERKAARRILVALVNFGNEGVPNTRRTRRYEEVARNEISRNVTQKLVQARLLVAGYDISLKQNTVEIIHEALIYKWALMLEWMDKDKEFLQIYSEFTNTVRGWEASGKDKSFLYLGIRLSRLIEALEGRKDETLNSLEGEFLEESRSYDVFAEELEKRVLERTADLQREQQNTETLLRVLTELSSSLDLDRALIRALSLINEAIGAEHSSIMLLRAEDNLLHYQVGYGFLSEADEEECRGIILKVGEGLAGEIFQTQQSVLINDLAHDSQWTYASSLLRNEYRSVIGVPMNVGEDVIGVLMTFSRTPGIFSMEMLNLVKGIASQMSVTVNNSHLYELIRDQAERLGLMLRKEQEDASRSQAILEAVADGVLVTGVDNRITFVNSSTERILAIDANRLISITLDDFAELFGEVINTWTEKIRSWSDTPSSYKAGESYTEKLKMENGHIVLLNLAPVILQNDFLGTVTIFRDVTTENPT